jgi:methylated-DNA-[protein]-cysteine S-methyltransferase
MTGVYFEHHWYRPDVESLGPRVAANSDAVFVRARSQLAEYLCGVRTEFERRVWAILAAIPYGETVSYGEVAATLAEGTTAQEAGQAVGRNPLSIVVPCHRVVGKNGALTGYAGGLARKKFLLELEEPVEAKEARLF